MLLFLENINYSSTIFNAKYFYLASGQLYNSKL